MQKSDTKLCEPCSVQYHAAKNSILLHIHCISAVLVLATCKYALFVRVVVVLVVIPNKGFTCLEIMLVLI